MGEELCPLDAGGGARALAAAVEHEVGTDQHEPQHGEDEPGDGQAPAALPGAADLAQREDAEDDARDGADHRDADQPQDQRRDREPVDLTRGTCTRGAHTWGTRPVPRCARPAGRAIGARALPGERVLRVVRIVRAVRGLRAGRSRRVGLRGGSAQGSRLGPGEIVRPRGRAVRAGAEVAGPRRGVGGTAAERARPGLNPGRLRGECPRGGRREATCRGRGHAAGPGAWVTWLMPVRSAVVDPELPARGRGRPGRVGLPVGRRHETRWRRRPAGGRV